VIKSPDTPTDEHRRKLVETAAVAGFCSDDLSLWDSRADVPPGTAQRLLDTDAAFADECERASEIARADGALLKPAAVRLAMSAVENMQQHLDSGTADFEDAVAIHKAAQRAIEHADRVAIALRDKHGDLPMVTFTFGGGIMTTTVEASKEGISVDVESTPGGKTVPLLADVLDVTPLPKGARGKRTPSLPVQDAFEHLNRAVPLDIEGDSQ
jgi:hypothetical protein